MATVLLAIGDTDARSDPFTLAAGEEATLIFRPGAGSTARDAIGIEVQDSDEGWVAVAGGRLNSGNSPLVLCAPGTYSLTRTEGTNAGADKA